MWACPIDTRVRAVILHEEKILLMRLKWSSYFVLPGGGWEAPETSIECLKREMHEELGINVEVQKIASVHEYQFRWQPSNELWYFVENSEDFLDTSKLLGSHSDEFEAIWWFDLSEPHPAIMPEILEHAHRYWTTHGKVFFQG